MDKTSRTPDEIFLDIEDVFMTATTSRDYSLALLVARKMSAKLTADILSNRPGRKHRLEAMYEKLTGLADFAFNENMGPTCRAIYFEFVDGARRLRKSGSDSGREAFEYLTDQLFSRIVFATESDTAVSKYLVTEVFPDLFYSILAETSIASDEFDKLFSRYLEQMLACARSDKTEAAVRMSIATCVFPKKFAPIANEEVRWTRVYRYLRGVQNMVETGLSQATKLGSSTLATRKAVARAERITNQGLVAGGVARELVNQVGALEEWHVFLLASEKATALGQSFKERLAQEIVSSLAALSYIPPAIRVRKQNEFLALLAFEVGQFQKIFKELTADVDRDNLIESLVSRSLRNSIKANDVLVFEQIWKLLLSNRGAIHDSSKPERGKAFDNILMAAVIFAREIGAVAEIQATLTDVLKIMPPRISSEMLAYTVRALFDLPMTRERVLALWGKRPDASTS